MIEYAVKRGEIYWIEPDNAFGEEIKKKRPGVVISKDNYSRGVVTIVYMTSKPKDESEPHHRIKKTSTGYCEGSNVLFDQITGVDAGRLLGCAGTVSAGDMEAIEEGVLERLGIDCEVWGGRRISRTSDGAGLLQAQVRRTSGTYHAEG